MQAGILSSLVYSWTALSYNGGLHPSNRIHKLFFAVNMLRLSVWKRLRFLKFLLQNFLDILSLSKQSSLHEQVKNVGIYFYVGNFLHSVFQALMKRQTSIHFFKM